MTKAEEALEKARVRVHSGKVHPKDLAEFKRLSARVVEERQAQRADRGPSGAPGDAVARPETIAATADVKLKED